MVVIHLAEKLLLSPSKTPSRLLNSVFPYSMSEDSSAGKWESKTTLDEPIIVTSLLRSECTDITTRFTITSELRVAEGGMVRLLITVLGFVDIEQNERNRTCNDHWKANGKTAWNILRQRPRRNIYY